VVLISPLHAVQAGEYDDVSSVLGDLRRITPVWYFGSPRWLARSPDYWADVSHFEPPIGRMMLERALGGAMPGIPQGFGRLVEP